METHHRTQAPPPVTPLAPPEADIFLDLWKAEVRRAYAFRRALEKAEAFVADFEGGLFEGVDELLAEMRAALAGDPPGDQDRKPSRLADLALFALIPLCLAATAGVIWSHLL